MIEPADLAPRAFLRLTDNWLGLSVRFLVTTHGIREVKDRIGREVLAAFEREGIRVASQTVEVTHLPAVIVKPTG